jgi:hypothetical protein
MYEYLRINFMSFFYAFMHVLPPETLGVHRVLEDSAINQCWSKRGKGLNTFACLLF